MSTPTATNVNENNKETGSNKLLIGAVIIFIIFIVICGIVTAVSEAVNSRPPVTMTPGAGNGLRTAAPLVIPAPPNIHQIK